LPSDNRIPDELKLELAYFSGYAWLMQDGATGGAGVMLRFERVRPRRVGAFSRSNRAEITPGFSTAPSAR
jgi:hypothetical protein